MKVLVLFVAVLCVAAADTRVYVVRASKSDMGNSIVRHKPVKQEKTSLKIAVSVQSTVENQTAVNKLVSVENQTAVNKLAIAENQTAVTVLAADEAMKKRDDENLQKLRNEDFLVQMQNPEGTLVLTCRCAYWNGQHGRRCSYDDPKKLEEEDAKRNVEYQKARKDEKTRREVREFIENLPTEVPKFIDWVLKMAWNLLLWFSMLLILAVIATMVLIEPMVQIERRQRVFRQEVYYRPQRRVYNIFL